MLLIILAIIYRNPITMLLPLITIGASLLTAQGALAAISLLIGLAISNQTIALLSAMIAGAGTDYAVFLDRRYHDYVRLGEDSVHAVRNALVSIGKVVAASAATVGLTFLGMGFTRLGLFSTIGVALAIGIGVAFLAAVTLLPAILVFAGPRGWVEPRSDRTAQFWRRSGIRIVRRPSGLSRSRAWLSCSWSPVVQVWSDFNYDDRKQLPESAESSIGYAAMDRHFPLNPDHSAVPLHPIAARLPHPRRALADIEQMAQRVSQLPGIAMVRGVTRPTGGIARSGQGDLSGGRDWQPTRRRIRHDQRALG